MANCSKCGTNVGCPCNLKGGLCSFCRTQAVSNKNTPISYEDLIATSNVNK